MDDGGTLSMNKKSFLKCPKCGSNSIEDKIKQNEYQRIIDDVIVKRIEIMKNRKKRIRII